MAHFERESTPARRCLRPDRRKRSDVVAVSAHLPAVLMGLRWLYDTVQPPEAAIDPDRHHLPSARGRRTLRFNPVGRGGAATIELGGSTRREAKDAALAAAELAAFVELVDGLGEEVVDTWIGNGATVGGVVLGRPAHPSLMAAVARFEAHGPTGQGAAIGLTTVQRTVLERDIEIRQFAGPWPKSLDPSGLLSRVAAGAVASLMAMQWGLPQG